MRIAFACGLFLTLLSTLATADQPDRFSSAVIRRDYRGALALADLLVAARPADPWAHFRRGEALERLRRTDEATSEYEAAYVRFGRHRPELQAKALYAELAALSNGGACARTYAVIDRFGMLAHDDYPSVWQAGEVRLLCPWQARVLSGGR